VEKFWIIVAIGLTLILVGRESPAAEYVYSEVFVGAKLRTNDWSGDYPSGVEIGYHRDFGKWYGEVYLNHMSNLERGQPFNDRHETWVETAGLKFGWRFDL